ncbi:MAG TPA: HlyD family secretion protein [Kofleriaceae bacterium]|nr:HlyD family secretion protein [Kofleriaceae bacterium]
MPPTRGRKAFTILAIVSALAIGGYLFYGWMTRGRVRTDNAMVDADVTPVSARVGGTVATVHVADHQRVEANAPLIDLEPADLAAGLARAEAELAAAVAQAAAADAQVEIVRASSTGGRSSAQAQVSASGASARTADAQVKAAQATLARAQADLERTRSDLAREQELLAKGALPGATVEHTRSAFEVAQAAADAARAQLAAAQEQRRLAVANVAAAEGRFEQSSPVEAQVRAAEAQARLAHARVDAAAAAVEQARLELAHAHVTAPIAGTVSRLAVHPGQGVSPGTPLVVIVPDETYVVANLKETEIHRIEPGEPVDIEIDAFPDRTFHGKVASIAAATGARFSLLPPDNATGNFVKVVQHVPVKIVWDPPPTGVPLRAGLSAEVTIHVAN